MSVKLLTEHHLEFLSLIGGCSGSSESTLVKMPHCWNDISTLHLGRQLAFVAAETGLTLPLAICYLNVEWLQIYLKPKVTLHFELLNISLLF